MLWAVVAVVVVAMVAVVAAGLETWLRFLLMFLSCRDFVCVLWSLQSGWVQLFAVVVRWPEKVQPLLLAKRARSRCCGSWVTLFSLSFYFFLFFENA